MKQKVLLSLFCAVFVQAEAAVTLPSIIGDNMVLQRDQSVPVWGWANAGEKVTVRFAAQMKTATADSSGQWRVQLDTLKASAAPVHMEIAGENTLTLTNILVGEVWLCSGQSNMEKPVGKQPGQRPCLNYEEELRAATYPEIRFFKTPKTKSNTPGTNVPGAWVVCGSNSLEATKFSAAGYFFGRELHKSLKVPVGLIDSTWGGTRVEPWTPAEGLEMDKGLYADFKDLKTGLSTLYNGMISPLVPFGIRGAIWYQGESNLMAHDGPKYANKFENMIKSWRGVWKEGDFPFYFVQLAPYSYAKRSTNAPAADALPIFWETQERCLEVKNTGLITITDLVDNLKDIHPVNKAEVGRRLALIALAKTYGQNVPWSGPVFKVMNIQANKAVLSFDYAGGLKSADGKPLTWFTIAGQDKNFVPAEAVIDGDKVVVSSPSVEKPVAVRFAWHESAQPNLCNAAGLPVRPFRTDK